MSALADFFVALLVHRFVRIGINMLIDVLKQAPPHVRFPKAFQMSGNIEHGLLPVWHGFEKRADLIGHRDEII